MKILFICHYEITEDQLNTASWIQGIISYLVLSHKLILVSGNKTKQNYNKISVDDNKEIHCYQFSLNDFENGMKDVLTSHKPDVIIIFGTECVMSYKALTVCKENNLEDITAIFSQGFCTSCAEHYIEGLPQHVVNRYTIRDFIRRDRIKDQKKGFSKRAITEQAILKETRHFIGRTTFDKTLLRTFNEKAIYYKCNDVLRNAFYENEWSYEKCEKHRIFVSQYYYPVKGFHFLLEALSIIVKRFPDVTVAAAGYNPINKGFLHNELKDSSYIRHLKTLVKKYHLENNVLLLGNLDEEEMKKQYLMANVFVMPSVIENSPNSLAEAMILGVPSVVSDVGGVTDFAKHREDAYIYPSTDSYLLANYITEIFVNVDKSKAMGQAAREKAIELFDRETNKNRFEEICMTIAKDR